MSPIPASFPGMADVAGQFAPLMAAEIRPVDLHRFPSGENLGTPDGDLGEANAAFLATLRDSDRLALPPRITAATARDIASSGRTIERLADAGSRRPVRVLIDAVFAGSAHADLLSAGAARVVITNSIAHPSNALSLSPLIAEALLDLGKDIDRPARRSHHSRKSNIKGANS